MTPIQPPGLMKMSLMHHIERQTVPQGKWELPARTASGWLHGCSMARRSACCHPEPEASIGGQACNSNRHLGVFGHEGVEEGVELVRRLPAGLALRAVAAPAYALRCRLRPLGQCAC